MSNSTVDLTLKQYKEMKNKIDELEEFNKEAHQANLLLGGINIDLKSEIAELEEKLRFWDSHVIEINQYTKETLATIQADAIEEMLQDYEDRTEPVESLEVFAGYWAAIKRGEE